jgi:ATP-dependent helicase HrpB
VLQLRVILNLIVNHTTPSIVTRDLPIHAILPELRRTLVLSRCAVLSAPPGSGKTTVVPLALLSEPWLAGQRIIMLTPRRLAARLAASFMAGQLGESVGQTVGYRVRFDSKVSARTRVEVVTEGMLTRRLQSDPELAGVGLVIFDEFHERSLESDLALALCRDVLTGLREDLRLLVMSATMDTEAVSRLLDQAPVVIGHGRMFPVDTVYLPPPSSSDSSRPDHVATNTARAIRQALTEQEGDLLAFLPGIGEISRTLTLLSPIAAEANLVLLPLHGSLNLADQDRAILPDAKGRRRVILATTIAETSITIEGISMVVDCGWKRLPRFDPNSGLSRLDTVRISRASANQRTGRAGRLGPGVCFRLWNMGVEHGLQPFDRPEIMEADLAPLALQLSQWGVADPGQLAWLDPPPSGAMAQARELLTQLNALDHTGAITATGKAMATLPLHPRLAHMLCESRVQEVDSALVCDLAALLSERDILTGPARSVDIEDRLHALRLFREQGPGAARALSASPDACGRINQVSRQLADLLARPRKKISHGVSVGTLLALAFPDRVAQQRADARGSYLLASGRGAKLPQHDPLANSPYLAVINLDAGRQQGHIFLAARLEKDEIMALFSKQVTKEERVQWEAKAETVSARLQVRFGALVLMEKTLPGPDPEMIKAALLKGIAEMGLAALPWNKKARDLQARIMSLRSWQPEENWPDMSDNILTASMAVWLTPFLNNIRSRQQLQGLNLEEILKSRLDWRQQQRLDREAPTHFQVPSGTRVKLQYGDDGSPPVLAVRLQEMFGMAETPMVNRGRMPVLLHLLSPAQRPVQITSDLRGFWDRSYGELKKELKGRYPRHHWPDDPWTAVPTGRVKPRK